MTRLARVHRECRLGHWLPQNARLQRQWLHELIKQVDENQKPLHNVLRDFKNRVEESTHLYLLSNMMFDGPFCNTSSYSVARDFDHLLQILNHLISSAPSWSAHDNVTGNIGCPMTVVFENTYKSEAGFAFFQDPFVNLQLKKILDVWSQHLNSIDSATVLNESTNGWFGPAAMHYMTSEANAARSTSLSFEQIYQCHQSAKHMGFNSWDQFFTRQFRSGVRPVVEPNNHTVIANCCESRPHKIARNVKERDRFWIKGHPYSVMDMLAFDDLACHFVGGTVYQAYLSALAYHRWHSPVSGTIVKAYVKFGTYFSKPTTDKWLFEALESDDHMDTWEGFTTAVATRAIIFIEADNQDIGLMCVMPVGMVEVSTCEITVRDGQHVNKGQQLGMFHYGGSTHCVMFRRGVEVREFPDPEAKNNVPVCGKLASIVPSPNTS